MRVRGESCGWRGRERVEKGGAGGGKGRLGKKRTEERENDFCYVLRRPGAQKRKKSKRLPGFH